MARAQSVRRRAVTTILAWLIGFLIFFPILWTIITSFKTELEAFSTPPKFLFFEWTMENYGIVQERSNYLRFVTSSLILSIGSTVVALLFAIPAAWAMAFAPAKRTTLYARMDGAQADHGTGRWRGGSPLPAGPLATH